ncbi:hypothetical protein IAQ61_011659 [Plenodomus lingam]|uniref:uncharacterized protein n=1 Tax=Leptosphaeria maculans TaxID=5022 RepID=UPI0033198BE4|nr:hypothetical protein IAQ61_011659 [Plenodomus lingam]
MYLTDFTLAFVSASRSQSEKKRGLTAGCQTHNNDPASCIGGLSAAKSKTDMGMTHVGEGSLIVGTSVFLSKSVDLQ